MNIKITPLSYRHETTELEGRLAWDESRSGRRPGALVVHEWMGIGEHEVKACTRLAEAGYLALAVDIFGRGRAPRTVEEAQENAGRYRGGDRSLLRARARAGLEALRAHPLCDPARVVALGFCFGGTTALELARDGADLRAVASFHGGLDTPRQARAETLKASVLALHGADDPFVAPNHVQDFEEEMRRARADWVLVAYGGTVHSFTNEGAGNDPAQGFAYNAKSARRAWKAMEDFFTEALG
jgi:dienelactone hydrolase